MTINRTSAALSLDSLPRDLQGKIVSALPLADQLSAAQVGQSLRQAVLQVPVPAGVRDGLVPPGLSAPTVIDVGRSIAHMEQVGRIKTLLRDSKQRPEGFGPAGALTFRQAFSMAEILVVHESVIKTGASRGVPLERLAPIVLDAKNLAAELQVPPIDYDAVIYSGYQHHMRLRMRCVHLTYEHQIDLVLLNDSMHELSQKLNLPSAERDAQVFAWASARIFEVTPDSGRMLLDALAPLEERRNTKINREDLNVMHFSRSAITLLDYMLRNRMYISEWPFDLIKKATDHAGPSFEHAAQSAKALLSAYDRLFGAVATGLVHGDKYLSQAEEYAFKAEALGLALGRPTRDYTAIVSEARAASMRNGYPFLLYPF